MSTGTYEYSYIHHYLNSYSVCSCFLVCVPCCCPPVQDAQHTCPNCMHIIGISQRIWSWRVRRSAWPSRIGSRAVQSTPPLPTVSTIRVHVCLSALVLTVHCKMFVLVCWTRHLPAPVLCWLRSLFTSSRHQTRTHNFTHNKLRTLIASSHLAVINIFSFTLLFIYWSPDAFALSCS